MEIKTEDIRCGKCPLRAKYDHKPKSFAGKFWRFHINFCPGWRIYMQSLPAEERVKIATQYQQKKFM
ncbi:MAG: hypothetical protein EOL88_07715 [Bacteroidia bacterium]|jgi:hypothetical protein|nr:hypothetical protein [Bacteroidales bacterium]NCD41963.1 hypothetical protein [Bacteroidia bacterium]MDD2323294.1 hypothetical protein [Bacteroidales bacterium]MDD3011171.1 hypothetical protein [Bacteroidales bacterium]MDD3962291.1 hypothetical protein [Bacteroidales bacterium]